MLKRLKTGGISYLLTALLLFWQGSLAAQIVSYGLEEDIFHPVYAQNGMVSSVNRTATLAGVEVLKKGGNAVDAAVAVGYVLAVTHPQAGNIGGGGFMLLRTNDGKTTAIDFREVAPLNASRDMFLDAKGNADPEKSLTSHLASGVPGTVAGFALANKKYGSMPMSALIQPAIKLAKEGFIVNEALADDLNVYGREVLLKNPTSRAIFFKPDGSAWQKGEVLVQPDLANSLTLIARDGADAFYKGKIADDIVAQMAQNGGLISKADLAAYRAVERQPVSGTYKGYEIFSMPPPSSGGVHIIQIMNILENFDLQSMGHNSAEAIHTMAEAMKYAYADRSEYLGDPDFVSVPVQQLISKTYAKEQIASQIVADSARASITIKPGNLTAYESDQTTHFSVVDAQGNAAAVTYTLNTNFGSGIVAGKSGILLNNQMDDFSAKPGVPNMYGLIGGDANAVQAGKRPLSSMSPTIVTKNGELVLVTGSPGGSRIITTVLQVILNTIEFNMNIAEATNSPRIHHQWIPEEIRIEKGISPDTIKYLEQKGHKVSIQPAMGSTQSIVVTPDGLFGAADPRSKDDLAAGY
ncbi:MAG: gamma-glutamyltransferase [Enterobacteriaceae bacterium]|jgi:gamma-glutamyltranspeptidase/glutathione hydrolase|nr:gamma-glutamyltransferase [Enterobacteriaceae bacterium]